MKLCKIYDLIEELVSGFFIITGLGLVFYTVIMRYLFSAAPMWGEEYSVYLVVWGALLGCSVAQREGRHIAVNFIYDSVPSRFQQIFNIGSAVISLAFCIFWVYSGFLLDRMYLRTGWLSLNSEMPLWIFYLIVPFSGAILALRFLQVIFARILKKNR